MRGITSAGSQLATLNTDRLVSLLSSVKSAGDPDVKIVLKKLEEEARERRSRGAGCSMDFFSTTFHAVSRLRGTSNAALRLSCLFECAYYFFLKGQTRPSIAAIKEVLALAHSVDDSSWKVKANTMAGIIYADAGHTSEAFLNYAAALQGCRQRGRHHRRSQERHQSRSCTELRGPVSRGNPLLPVGRKSCGHVLRYQMNCRRPRQPILRRAISISKTSRMGSTQSGGRSSSRRHRPTQGREWRALFASLPLCNLLWS